MARVTVEDCEEIVANRFDLVVLAAQRTRQIIGGDPATLESRDEKKPVIALREIAAQSISLDNLRESTIKGFRTFSSQEDLEEDIEDLPEEDTYNPYEGVSVALPSPESFESSDAVENNEEKVEDPSSFQVK
ncbi:MAG: DNA-directed RNA polymerase subunit omega [Holosporaceae bacterium]|jgi:DNA-directed RNA polymerase subunit omega|nr:DNA-directed RNA polymerase subunit omega [Holosporaceae bacterium]